MGERVNRVNKVIKDFEKDKKSIEKKYSDKDIKDEIKNVDKAIKDANVTLNIKNLHIKKLENELAQLSPNEKDLIEAYKKSINEEKNDSEYKTVTEKVKEYLDKKEELSIKLSVNKKSNEKAIKQETREAEDKLRADLTQEGMQLDKDINRTELNMKLVLADMKDFKYEYEEKDGLKIPINGDKLAEINDKYEKLKKDLSELKEAKKICEDKLKEFKDRDNKKMEQFSKTWNEVKNAAVDETTKGPKKEPEKEPTKEPEKEPEKEPTKEPEKEPEKEPTKEPEKEPEKEPTKEPEKEPEKEPTKEPEKEPEKEPTKEPEKEPEKEPTKEPEKEPENEVKLIKIDAATKKANVFYGPISGNYEIDTDVNKQLDIDEVIAERKELYKRANLKEIMKLNGVEFPIQQAILRRKINPVIIKAIEDDPQLIDEYVNAVLNKEYFPFEYSINLENSELSKKDFKIMNRLALKEAKIEGNEVIGAKSRLQNLKDLFSNIRNKKLFKKAEKVEELPEGKDVSKLDTKSRKNIFKDAVKITDEKLAKLEAERISKMEEAYKGLTDEQKEALPNLSASEIQRFGIPYNEAVSLLEEYGNKEPQENEKTDVNKETQENDKEQTNDGDAR